MRDKIILFIIVLLNYQNGFCQNDTAKIQYENIDVDCLKNISQCDDCKITSEKKGKVLTADFRTKGDCIQYKTADSLYSILGAGTTCGGCAPPDTSIEVIKIISQKKYVCSFRVKQIGFCKMLHHPKFWIMIPKIEHGYDVEYKFYEH